MGRQHHATVAVSSTTKYKVLVLALEGNGVRSIADLLNLNPSTVSRHLKYWVGQGYLVRASPRGSVAHFERGPNLSEEVLHRVLHDATPLATEKTATTVGCGRDFPKIDLMPTIGGGPHHGFIPMRIHSLGHRFKVLKGPDNGVPWTRSTTCSTVPTHILEMPINGHDPMDERRVKIVFRDGSADQSVEVWTPEVTITNPLALQEFPEWAAARAQRVANWLSRKFGFQLGIVEMAREPHFAAAVPRAVAQAAKEMGLETPNLWMDTSRGKGEFETPDPVMAASIMEVPARFDRLENVMFNVVCPTLEKMVESQERLYGEFAKLNDYLLQFLGKFDEAKEKPKDTDPGGMFG